MGLKKTVIQALRSCGLTSAIRRANAGRLLIVMYHGVISGERDWQHWCQLPEEEFRWQLEFLKRHYDVLPLSEIVSRLSSGEPLPNHTAAITFDDGLRNNYKVAWPILRELELPATMYVVTGFMNSERLLWQDRLFAEVLSHEELTIDLSDFTLGSHTWAQADQRQQVFDDLLAALKQLPSPRKDEVMSAIIRQTSGAGEHNPVCADFQLMSWDNAAEMQASGLIEIGGHTVNHELLSRLNDEQVASEIINSCRTVAERLGTSSPTFAFPNGTHDDFDSRVFAALKDADMKAAVTTVSGLNRTSDPMFELRRIGIGADMPRWQFEAEVCGLMDGIRSFRSRGSLMSSLGLRGAQPNATKAQPALANS